MGNVNARQIDAKMINSQINLINTVNRFLNKDKPEFDNNKRKCKNEKQSQINEKSNINKFLNSNKTIELSTDLISIFSNQHINHFNNGNLYASLLTPNIYETSEEEKNNLSPKISQANYTTHTFNRINDILNVNNDKLILDKVNILRNLTKSPPNMSKDVFIFNSANQNYGLNESYNSNYNDLINEPNGNLSRGHSKRYTRLNTFVTKKSADGIYYEEEPPFSSRDNTYKKKKSSKSIRHITLNDSPYQKIPLNKISEDNNQDLEKEEKEFEKQTMISKSKSKTVASKQSHDLTYLKEKKIYSKFNNTNRKNNYAQFIRTKFFNGSFKRKEIKNSFERNRFDLFNSKIIDQLRTEEKKDISKKNNNNGMLINSKNNKLKKESNINFKINLKLIIKQEIQEKLNTPKLENKTEKIVYTTTNKKLFSENSSEYFKDSINKYLNFDNTITKSFKKSTRKSSKILKSPSLEILSSIKNNKNNDLLRKVSISKFNEKENTPNDLSPVRDSLLLQHIEMLNLDDCL